MTQSDNTAASYCDSVKIHTVESRASASGLPHTTAETTLPQRGITEWSPKGSFLRVLSRGLCGESFCPPLGDLTSGGGLFRR